MRPRSPAAGGGFFLCYSGALLGDDERRAIGRRIEIWVAAAVVLSALRILLTAGSLAGDASGMIDRKLIHMVWRSGEDTAVITRIAGLLLAVRAALPARRSRALAAVGAACAAMSFAWTGHAHATGDSWTVACVALHVVCAAFWIGALGPLAFLAQCADPRRAGAAASRFGRIALAVGGSPGARGDFRAVESPRACFRVVDQSVWLGDVREACVGRGSLEPRGIQQDQAHTAAVGGRRGRGPQFEAIDPRRDGARGTHTADHLGDHDLDRAAGARLITSPIACAISAVPCAGRRWRGGKRASDPPWYRARCGRR